jgi:hypothetical protein
VNAGHVPSIPMYSPSSSRPPQPASANLKAIFYGFNPNRLPARLNVCDEETGVWWDWICDYDHEGNVVETDRSSGQSEITSCPWRSSERDHWHGRRNRGDREDGPESRRRRSTNWCSEWKPIMVRIVFIKLCNVCL